MNATTKYRAALPAAALTFAFLSSFLCLSGLPAAPARASDETWAIYWYVCGSDLETENGFAGIDLQEAAGVALPDNVKLVIQTGGAKKWNIGGLDARALYRLKHTGNGIDVVDSVPLASMGDPDTLRNFLQFCHENYPADRRVLILWNHGAGSGGGICYDELYDNDCLDFDEIRSVLIDTYGVPPDEKAGESYDFEKPFELIGFDACLMATLDMAGVVAPYARYMVASEELEPGLGWNYSGMLSALARNPGMNGAELGRVICDTYYTACAEYGLEGTVTLSTLDLSKVNFLNRCVSAMTFRSYMEIIRDVDPAVLYAAFARGAKKADNYKNSMIDLKSLALANTGLFPNIAEMIADAVDDCVTYQVRGPYRKNSNGISVYLPKGANDADFDNYRDAAEAGETQHLLYMYEPLVIGFISEAAQAFISRFMDETFTEEEPQPGDEDGDDEADETDAGDEDSEKGTEEEKPTAPQRPDIASFAAGFQFAGTSAMGFGDHPTEFAEEDGVEYIQMTLGPDRAKYLKSVTFVLYALDSEAETVTILGEDANVTEDWDRGVFRDNFTGDWMGIDGHTVNTNVSSVTDEYILYEVPVYIEDRLYRLTVAYDMESGGYTMQSARPDESETGGIPAKEERRLRPGDVVSTAFDDGSGKDGETLLVKKETFTITEDTEFGEMTLPDGVYSLMYLMVDSRGEVYSSVMTDAEVTDGEVSFIKEK